MIFDLNNIKNQFGDIKGIIHIGAHAGGEVDMYRNFGLQNTIFFEPQKHLYETLTNKLLPTEKSYNVALGDIETELDLYISKFAHYQEDSGASSSFLKPKVHLTEHPHVLFDGTTEKCTVKTLDNVVKENNIDLNNYNFLNIDVQGYELKVLQGAIKTLPYIKFIIAEVNRDEVYEGCPIINEIDHFLKQFSFNNTDTRWQSTSWGDALYVKSI